MKTKTCQIPVYRGTLSKQMVKGLAKYVCYNQDSLYQVFFTILYYYWGREYGLFCWGLQYNEVHYIEVLLYKIEISAYI